MRAVVVRELGSADLASIESFSMPPIEDGQVRVKVLSAGVTFPELLKLAGKYQIITDPPFIPGSDVCGEVVEVGSDVTEYKLGEHVFGTIAPGGDMNGGLASHAILEPEALYHLPTGVSPHVAAGFEVNYGTTYHGLVDLGGVAKGDTVLVLGASGGVGMAAIDIAKALGATVVAAASSGDKLAACKAAGATTLAPIVVPIEVLSKLTS